MQCPVGRAAILNRVVRDILPIIKVAFWERSYRCDGGNH